MLVTSGHVFSEDRLINESGWLDESKTLPVMLNSRGLIGKWVYQQILPDTDIALIQLDENFGQNQIMKFAATGFYTIDENSVKNEKVTLISNRSGLRDGFILDYHLTWPIPYKDTFQNKFNVILLGSSTDRNSSVSLSQKGDSGGLVFHKNTGKLIGMILGGDKKFTWVLPIEGTLRNTELTII